MAQYKYSVGRIVNNAPDCRQIPYFYGIIMVTDDPDDYDTMEWIVGLKQKAKGKTTFDTKEKAEQGLRDFATLHDLYEESGAFYPKTFSSKIPIMCDYDRT